MKQFTLKFLVAISFILAGFSSQALPQNQQFSRLFIFGDSLSDVGNTYKLFFGIFPESPPYYSGRFSNGPLWIERFSKEFNFKPESIFNYAFGGARAIKDLLPVPSLDQQVAKYLKWNRSGSDPNALYVIWIGSNDIINDEYKCNDIKVVTKISNHVKEQLELLIKHGAKTFLIPNIPAIAVTPLALEQDAQNRNNKYSTHIDEMTLNYNYLLQENLNDLQIKYPDVKFLRFDSYKMLETASDYAQDFGIKNIYQRCNPNWYLDGYSAICRNPDEYLFWDTVHPSAVGHTVLSFFITNTFYYDGYRPNEPDYIPTYEDLIIAKNNTKALAELTARKLDYREQEMLLRNKLLF